MFYFIFINIRHNTSTLLTTTHVLHTHSLTQPDTHFTLTHTHTHTHTLTTHTHTHTHTTHTHTHTHTHTTLTHTHTTGQGEYLNVRLLALAVLIRPLQAIISIGDKVCQMHRPIPLIAGEQATKDHLRAPGPPFAHPEKINANSSLPPCFPSLSLCFPSLSLCFPLSPSLSLSLLPPLSSLSLLPPLSL